jgi:hypothetical protein
MNDIKTSWQAEVTVRYSVRCSLGKYSSSVSSYQNVIWVNCFDTVQINKSNLIVAVGPIKMAIKFRPKAHDNEFSLRNEYGFATAVRSTEINVFN